MDDSDIFDPFDVDREEFNPHMCMLRYAEECSFLDMLSIHHRLDNEIRDLNSDLQNMLYDNYSKFINSASVISNMKTDFQKMETEIDLLHAKMSTVEHKSSGILSNLRPTEKRIGHLLKCKDTMQKLVLLTDLVPTLKEYVDSGMYKYAAKHYLKAEPVLKKYKHLASLSGIVKDCADIIHVVKSGLEKKQNCDIYGKEELCETLNLLLSLGETPISVAKQFLSCSDKCLVFHLSSTDGVWEKEQKESSIKKDALMDVIINYISLCCDHVDKIRRIVDVIKEVFSFKSEINIEGSIHEISHEFFIACVDKLSSKLQQRVTKQFHAIDDDFLSQVLDKFNRQCHTSGIVTPRLNFHEKGMDIVVKICAARCEFHLKNLKDDFNNIVINVEREVSECTNVCKLLVFLREWTEQKLMEVLKSVICYIRPEFRFCREASFRKIFSKVLVREGIFVSFFHHMSETIWHSVSTEQSKQPIKVLFLAKYLLDLQETAVPQFLLNVDEYLCSPHENLCLSSDADISTVFSSSAQIIVRHYANICSNKMICMIHKSMANKNWLKTKEPTRPRAVIKMIINEIQEIKTETEKIFSSSGNPESRTKDFRNPVFCRNYSIDSLSDRNSMEERLLLNKLFINCSEMSSKVDSSINSIMSCILRKTLKSFIEYIRMNTFNRFGLQQIQVDVCFLQFHVSRLSGFNNSFQELFDEMISSATNRTLKAEFMNNHVVSVICNDAF